MSYQFQNKWGNIKRTYTVYRWRNNFFVNNDGTWRNELDRTALDVSIATSNMKLLFFKDVVVLLEQNLGYHWAYQLAQS